MYIYILNSDGQPLMPTKRCRMVRRLLKSGEAKVVKKCPFTVQLLYSAGNIIQEITLGVDSGSAVIGLSATTNTNELFTAEVHVRNDVVNNIASRAEARRARRSRKTRYRKPRFLNRKKAKKKGWLAPSIRQKIETHENVISEVYDILPISNMIVEVASFDIQKIKNPEIEGSEYQEGEQLGFWNVREYVLARDGHKCQCCKGKSKDKILEVHHIESRKTGGNSPSNLVTLCSECHKKYHKGELEFSKSIRRGASFKDASFMGIMRWYLYEDLKRKYDNVSLTYGYVTKHDRIFYNLDKAHYIDVRCISGNIDVEPLGYYYCYKKVRRHNRQIHKFNILKGGKRKLNQAPKYVYDFCLFDKVDFNGVKCFITGRRSSGYFKLSDINGNVISSSISYKKIKLLQRSNGYMKDVIGI